MRSGQPWAARQAAGAEPFGLSPAPNPCSSTRCSTHSHRLSLQVSAPGTRDVPSRHQRPQAVNQFRWPGAWPSCLGPGLPSTVPCPCPGRPKHLCPSVRHPRFFSGLAGCQFGACGSGPSLPPLSPKSCRLCPNLGLLALPPAPPGQATVRVHLLIWSRSLLCPTLSVTEFKFRPNNLASSARGWALPGASRPRPLRPLAAGPPPLGARGSPSPRDLPHTPLSRTPIWALTARPHSSNRAGGALGPEAELFAGAASRDVASMVVAAATSQNQQLRARQASGAAILGRCASPRVAPSGRHLEKVSS